MNDMKKVLSIIIILSYSLIVTYTQTKKNSVMTEKYNMELTNNGVNNASYEKDGWLIDIYRMPKGYQTEFAPAKDFYLISKRFYTNGQLASKGKNLGYVKFGNWEYFDENGKLLQTVNEDAKFGVVKPSDIIDFLEKEKIIDRKSGKTIFTNEILKTDGSFYKETMKRLRINMMIKEDYINETGNDDRLIKLLSSIKEKTPLWLVSYKDSLTSRIIYYIDGNDINNFIKERIEFGYII